jgi:hypothetical protein
MKTSNNKYKKKNKIDLLREQIQKPVLLLLGFIFIIVNLGYSLGFPMINLWDLFVENLFGSFFIAVLFIALIYFIILILAGISYYTIIIFLMFYALAMAIGYGIPIITVIVTTFAVMYFMYQMLKWWNNQ